MPPANKNIRTLRDVTSSPDNRISSSATFVPSRDPPGPPPSFLQCFHIQNLPHADQAKILLERVVREFEPIVQRRGYNVASISEMCCCGDGCPDNSSGRMSRNSNIWGYNQTSWSRGQLKQHRIHVRLRHAASHGKFLAYEDVAGTLAHELAHCEYGPHNDKFYKLMDDILEQHAVLMSSSMQTTTYKDTATNTMFNTTDQGQRLGGSQSARGYKLGGDSTFSQWMTPTEAAAAAALARRRQAQLRLRGDRCCRIIDIADDVLQPHNENQEDERPGPSKQLPTKRKTIVECIDLTGDEEDTMTWSCRQCTFFNSHQVLACSICQSERTWDTYKKERNR